MLILDVEYNWFEKGCKLIDWQFDIVAKNLTKQERVANIVNGMSDSLLFGLGFGGAIVATTKNILRRIADENTKKKILEILQILKMCSYFYI